MSLKSFTTLVALAGVSVAAITSVATAAPSDQSDCQAVYDNTFDPNRSCDALQPERRAYKPPRTPQDPPVLKDWRDGIFDQALNSGGDGSAGGGGGGGSAGGNR